MSKVFGKEGLKYDPTKQTVEGHIISDIPEERVTDVSRDPPKPNHLPYKKLEKDDLEEGVVLTNLLAVLCNGIVKPNDITYQVEKLQALNHNGSLDDLVNCCPKEATIREAKDFKNLIGRVVDRLVYTLDI